LGIPFHQSARHTPIHALASAGGVALLSYAHDYVKAYPSHTALTITAECGSSLWSNGSLNYDLRSLIESDIKGNKEKIYQRIVVASLLGDAVSCCVVSGKQSKFLENNNIARKNTPEIVDTHRIFVPHTDTYLGSFVEASGRKVFMDRKLPDAASPAMVNVVSELLQKNNLSQKDITIWLPHPGGPKILHTVQTTLGMSDNDFRYSWKALYDVGNVSSVSVLHAYELAMAENTNISPGTYGVLVAVGPGLRVEAILLKW